ncbi:hypothetical protein [Deinococcus seoulensis]|nr:hypothetical protein [Deinococcus seoulensis]
MRGETFMADIILLKKWHLDDQNPEQLNVCANAQYIEAAQKRTQPRQEALAAGRGTRPA